VTATNLAVPVAVGGYRAKAADNGDLVGPVHEVPGLVPAAALNVQENAGGSLTVGTSAIVSHHFAKREAEEEKAAVPLVYAGYPYAHGYPYAGLPYAGLPYAYGAYPYAHGYPYVAVKPLELKTEVTATNLAVPVAVGGYRAKAADNGDLVGPVHEVPGLVPAAALNVQENAGGSLTVGTSAIVSHTLAKREAEAEPEADPWYAYGHGLGYAGYGYGHGYGHLGYAGHGYYGHGYGHAYGYGHGYGLYGYYG